MYFSIKEPFHYETVIKKSCFICDLIPVNNAEEAKDALATIRKRYYDATHHCSALRLGTTGTLQEQSNDDGEPAGTAGRPMLHVLQQRDMTNLLAVVTRYFGGIKLGTGGLARAYGGTLAESVSAAPIVAYVAHHRYSVQIPYDLLGALENAWKDMPYIIINRQFTDTVRFTMDVPATTAEAFEQNLTELTAARAVWQKDPERLLMIDYDLIK